MIDWTAHPTCEGRDDDEPHRHPVRHDDHRAPLMAGGGLIGLLDDVATLAKLAAASLDDVGAAAGKATTKAAGVLIDDAAVTPQYIQGVAAKRELPIIIRIAKGSFRNKLVFILPVALLLSQFLPWIVTPILMLGGAYLCYEAVHKIWGAIAGHDDHGKAEDEPISEEELVAGAIRTDLILSAEIMVIALKEVESEPLLSRALILALVAILITIIVYGVVALIVKADDVGLRMAQSERDSTASAGRRLVTAMPKVLTFISVLGTAAMLWVGGHIELVGLDELGLHGPYEVVHDLEESVHEAVAGVGGILAWLVNTIASAFLGLIVGGTLVAIQHAWATRRGTAAAH